MADEMTTCNKNCWLVNAHAYWVSVSPKASYDNLRAGWESMLIIY